MPSIPELILSSSFIFSGTVMEHGRSTVPDVPSSDKLVVVRLDRPLHVDPVLGDLRGKMITVAAIAPASLTAGQQAVFFTHSWAHGRGIAVREIEHRDIAQEHEVAAAVAQLPQLHLSDRLQSAEPTSRIIPQPKLQTPKRRWGRVRFPLLPGPISAWPWTLPSPCAHWPSPLSRPLTSS